MIELLEGRRLLSAGAVTVGAEVQVNTVTAGVQQTPAVAMDAAGDSVIVWTSANQDGSGYGVFARRYNAAGVALGSEFRVNTFTTGSQSAPSVAMNASGSFVIAWDSQGQDGDDYGIYAQRYNAAGVAQGTEFKVNTHTTSAQGIPTVAMDTAGDFTIAWESDDQIAVAGYTYNGIYAQRYNAAGVAQGGEFQVNGTTTEGNPSTPQIAMDAAGDFAVVWTSYPFVGPAHTYAQRFNAVGVKQGTDFNVSTATADYQFSPSIAMNSNGSFVITWTDDATVNGIISQVDAQRYNAAGAVQGAAFRVNTFTNSYEDNSSVAVDAAGDFVVSWNSYKQDGSYMGVYAQRFLAAGTPVGTEFLVNTATFGMQYLPAVASDAHGDFVVTWESYPQDGDGNGIYAQRYTPPAASGVNHAPAGTAKTVTILEDTAYVFKATDFGFTDANDTPPNLLFSVDVTTLPTAGTLTDNGIAVTAGFHVPVADITGGKLKFAPVANKNGAAYSSFTFQVQDDGGTANGGVNMDPTARKMTIAVTAVNDAPVGTAGTVTTKEDTAYVFKTADFGFTDPNDSPANLFLAVKMAALPTAGSLTDNGLAVTAGGVVTASDIAAGKVKFTPVANKNGAAYSSFTFQVQDNGGTANQGIDKDLTARKMTIAVTSVNDSPVGAAKTVTTLEDVAYVLKAADFGFADPNDLPANGFLAVKISTLPTAGTLIDNGATVSGGQIVTVAQILAGQVRFVPVANKNGSAYSSFTFQVQDNGGTANGGIDTDLTPRKMTVSVTSVNDAPVGTAKTVSTLEDTPYIFKLADFGFTDPNDSPANGFQAIKFGVMPTVGTLTDNGLAVTSGVHVPVADVVAGKLKYTPVANKNGATYANFTFEVQDTGGTANGGVDTDPIARKMTIGVVAVNDAPVGQAKTVATLKNIAYVFKATDFGFSDPNDSPANGFLAIKIATLPTVGTLTDGGAAVTAGEPISIADINAGKLKFTPALNGIGAAYASWTFRVQDNGGTVNGGIDTDSIARGMTISVS